MAGRDWVRGIGLEEVGERKWVEGLGERECRRVWE